MQSALRGEVWNKEKVEKVVAAIREHLARDNEYGVFEETESLDSAEKLRPCDCTRFQRAFTDQED